MLMPEIKDIISFLMKEEVKPIQSLMLTLLREKLKTFQSALTIKYIKIYEYRDKFEAIKETADPKEKATLV